MRSKAAHFLCFNGAIVTRRPGKSNGFFPLAGGEGKGTNGVKTGKNVIVQNDESKNDKAWLKFSKKKGKKPAKTPGRGKQNPSFREKKKRVWKEKEKMHEILHA